MGRITMFNKLLLTATKLVNDQNYKDLLFYILIQNFITQKMLLKRFFTEE